MSGGKMSGGKMREKGAFLGVRVVVRLFKGEVQY